MDYCETVRLAVRDLQASHAQPARRPVPISLGVCATVLRKGKGPAAMKLGERALSRAKLRARNIAVTAS
jgi:PleD family two-component response regulator